MILVLLGRQTLHKIHPKSCVGHFFERQTLTKMDHRSSSALSLPGSPGWSSPATRTSTASCTGQGSSACPASSAGSARQAGPAAQCKFQVHVPAPELAAGASWRGGAGAAPRGGRGAAGRAGDPRRRRSARRAGGGADSTRNTCLSDALVRCLCIYLYN